MDCDGGVLQNESAFLVRKNCRVVSCSVKLS